MRFLQGETVALRGYGRFLKKAPQKPFKKGL